MTDAVRRRVSAHTRVPAAAAAAGTTQYTPSLSVAPLRQLAGTPSVSPAQHANTPRNTPTCTCTDGPQYPPTVHPHSTPQTACGPPQASCTPSVSPAQHSLRPPFGTPPVSPAQHALAPTTAALAAPWPPIRISSRSTAMVSSMDLKETARQPDITSLCTVCGCAWVRERERERVMCVGGCLGGRGAHEHSASAYIQSGRA